jgi:hypothetical protein
MNAFNNKSNDAHNHILNNESLMQVQNMGK